MATSGSKDFELDVNEYVEEAFERCGLVARTGYDLRTARRSLNLMLADWANRGINRWTITQTTQALTTGVGTYTLTATTIDILSAVVRSAGVDYSLERLTRDDYINIPAKTQQSRVSQFYLDRQIVPVLKLWPVPDNSTDVVIFDQMVRMDDADAQTNTLEVPFRFYPALAAGLAYYISVKRAPDRIQVLKALYEEELDRAMSEDRDRASFTIVPSLDYQRYA
jgi:hypothetical protein